MPTRSSGRRALARGPRILIATDKYKGTLSSEEVADALASGLLERDATARVECVPVADGGDGSLAVALGCGAIPIAIVAADSDGVRRPTRIAMDGTRAIIEAAQICGLGASKPDAAAALRATSAGVGEAIRYALDLGAQQIVLATGGTATSDGGAGMLGALGLRLLDAKGRPVAPRGAGLGEAVTVDVTHLDDRLLGVDLILASDVDNPLLGPHGAANVYGPQKGAGPSEVATLEDGIAHFASLLTDAGACPASLQWAPGAGAGGGLGFGALVLGGRRVSGAEYFLELARFEEELLRADLVITGEGRLDEQSLHGKAPSIVAARARAAGVRVRAVAGSCVLTERQWRAAGMAAVDTLNSLDPRCEQDPKLSRSLLRGIGRRIGAELADSQPVPD